MQMQIILSRSICRFFRRSNVAYFPALTPPLHHFSPSSRFILDSMASVFHRQGATRLVAPNRPVPRVSRFRGGSSISSSSREMAKELGAPYSTQVMNNENNGPTIKESTVHPVNEEIAKWKNINATYGDESGSKRTMDVTNRKPHTRIDSKQDTWGTIDDVIALYDDGHHGNYKHGMRSETELDEEEDMKGVTESSDSEEYENWAAKEDVLPLLILENSTHRDGSIYRDNIGWKEDYCIADRNETRLGPMMFSDLKKCVARPPGPYLQFFSIKVARIPMDCGSVELYGYMAARDCLDPLLNYIFNISRDDPIIVEQGSLIEMTGPKRGINFYGNVLLEYDMRIKMGDQVTDDLQLIDGVTSFSDTSPISCQVLTNRILGKYGAIDLTRSLLNGAVEATVDVLISEVHTSFNLFLSSFFSGLHEIQLFHGTIGERHDLRRRFVIAVMMDTQMHLKFKVGDTAEHSCSFKAKTHGCATQQIIIEFASISVMVTWSTQPF